LDGDCSVVARWCDNMHNALAVDEMSSHEAVLSNRQGALDAPAILAKCGEHDAGR